MLQSICPKLPMRNKAITKMFYEKIGFEDVGSEDFDMYLIMQNQSVEIHFFLFEALDTKENYGQVYIRVSKIDELYRSYIDKDVHIHPNDKLQIKPWKQKEFSILDPDHNLITFGEEVI